jgi:retron-type reverse transcriptase
MSQKALSLWERLVKWENLVKAYQKASRGKRGISSAAHFEYRLIDKLVILQTQLIEKRFQPGPYTHFYVHDPKRRKISAAPFRDRVIHHALCQQIEPIFERLFIPESYANRRGKGTHHAIDQLQRYARKYRYVLRADIVKHFPSLDHAILRGELYKHIQDPDTRWLMDTIIDSGAGILADQYQMVYFPGDDIFAASRPRGLPIGNQTSQFWSNCYLNPFDWFVKRELGCSAYLRYVDDFALFSNSKAQLYEWKERLIQRLAKLRLTIHESETQALPVKQGIPWLGFVVYPDHRLVKSRKVIHFTRRDTALIRRYEAGQIPFSDILASTQGWVNYVRYADTYGLRRFLLEERPISPPRRPDSSDRQK